MKATHVIVVRVFIETTDDGTSQEFGRQLEARLGLGSPLQLHFSVYWKIPAWSEWRFVTNVADLSESTWNDILQRLGTGWQSMNPIDDEAWAVWSGTGTFFSPLVRWANVEVSRLPLGDVGGF